MTPTSSLRASLLALALGVLAPTVHADVPAPDTCSTLGKACSTAAPDYKHPGVCQEQTCSRTVPEPDGALRQMSYSCLRCVASGGAGGSTGDGGSGGKGGSAGAVDAGKRDASLDGGTHGPVKNSNCDCVIASSTTASTTAALVFVTGVAGLFVARRSRRK